MSDTLAPIAAPAWRRDGRFSPAGAALADRHYTRRTVGSPQFAPPGRLVVLVTTDERALWVVVDQKHVTHAWPGAWNVAIFRNEGPVRSSELVREAVVAVEAEWGKAPRGWITSARRTQAVASRRPAGSGSGRHQAVTVVTR